MPNETAPAHRHVAFAMRFIIEGNGGFTAVHGRRIQMQRGDVILTPTWNWHDHGKDGSGPMIWLDGLDLPLFRHFPTHFVEHFKEQRYPAESVDTSASPIVFPWSRMKKALDEAEAGDWVSKPYCRGDGSDGASFFHQNSLRSMRKRDPADKDIVSRTLGGSAERLTAGTSSPPTRETASSVYHVVSGTGHSEIDGKEITWKQGDTFCVPAWNKYQHFATAKETVYLYRFDDKPMLRSLGFYRVEGDDIESFVTEQ